MRIVSIMVIFLADAGGVMLVVVFVFVVMPGVMHRGFLLRLVLILIFAHLFLVPLFFVTLLLR